MRPEAVTAMLPFLTENYGNPSGTHSVARSARTALEDARENVAAALGCAAGEVVFTSGGTESDNLAVLGSARASDGGVVCSAIEHHAVLRACGHVGGRTVRVDSSGRVDLEDLWAALDSRVRLVSVMLANNEVGTVQPLGEIGEIVRDRAPDALLHTDAVAAVGWLDVADLVSAADLVSISSHKFGGPRGAGALVVRNGARLAPVLLGGEQERGRRAGTHDMAGIAGMAAALAIATLERPEQVARVGALRDRLAEGVITSVPGALESAVTSDEAGRSSKLASSFHVRFEGVDSEELLFLLDEAGICASAGAACASGAMEPSHVLMAMNVDTASARSAVRFSLGYSTTAEEVDHVLEVLPKIVDQLRS